METEKEGFFGRFRNYLSGEVVPFSSLMNLFLPLLAENFFTYGITLLNSAMISSSGMAALSAVTMVDTFVSMIITVFQGIATGAAIIVAQYHGAHKADRMRESAISSIAFVTLFGTMLTFFSIVFRRFLMGLLFGAAEEEVLSLAVYYLMGNCMTLPLHAFVVAELGVLRGVGESRNAMMLTLTNSVFYILGNILFIRVLHLSVTGLILSIGCTRAITFFGSFGILRKTRSVLRFRLHEIFHPGFSYLKRIIHFGMPLSLENLMFNGGRLILQVIVTPLGTNMIAAYNLSYNLLMAMQMVNTAVSTTMFVAAGMCMGAGRPDDLRRQYRHVFIVNTGIYAVIGTAMLLFLDPILRLFHPEADMMPVITVSVLMIAIVTILFHTPGFLTPNILRATGDVGYTTIVSALSMWIFRVGGAYLFGRVLGWGVPGVYMGMAADWIFRAVLFTIRYSRGQWEKIHVI